MIGFDTMFDIVTNGFDGSLILQHKVPEYFVRNSKRVGITPPYFGFKITNSQLAMQHNLLIDLEDLKFNTCYCTPKFYTNRDLMIKNENGRILTDSLNISPSKIGRFVDWGNHHYYYSTDGLNTAVRSEERNADPYDNVTTLLHGLTTTKITQENLSETTDKLKELIEKNKAKVPPLKVKQSNSLIELNHYIKNAIKADWLVFKKPDSF